jgi:energy-coupling factor transporter ATP-binding protein EcfA2
LLATKTELGKTDISALLALLFCEVGLEARPEGTPSPTYFEAGHLKSKEAPNVRLLGISGIENVNRLGPDGLNFASEGLTVIYGDNGSGKTGFIRILRKACRSRIEKTEDLEILANVYGSVSGLPAARLLISDGTRQESIDWKDGQQSDPRLTTLSVFDTRSAQLYVDEGNRLRFLPADLDLPYRLNDVISEVEDRLSPEVASLFVELSSPVLKFEGERDSTVRNFVNSLSSKTSDEEIDGACKFSSADENELYELQEALRARPQRADELRRAAAGARALANRAAAHYDECSEQARQRLEGAWHKVQLAREAHNTVIGLIAGRDPLPVGSGAWKRLWRAAEAYTVEVDGHHHFPDDGPVDSTNESVCPLCQQSALGVRERLLRFRDFMASETAAVLSSAELAFDAVVKNLRLLNTVIDDAGKILLASVRSLDERLATSLEARFAAAGAIRAAWIGFNGEGELAPSLSPDNMPSELSELAISAESQAQTVVQAQDQATRVTLEGRQNELTDRQRLSPCAGALKQRRNAIRRFAALKTAEGSCRRNEVTRQANIWVDTHLSQRAKEVFKGHLTTFRLQHLNVQLERQSNSFGTGYKNTISGGSGFRRVSDVLSEGEQRALSLAAFFTEAELERQGGTLIIDDPVSSLDRERSVAVAAQLVRQAATRQVIVFTHDLVFLQELGEAAKADQIEPTFARVFSAASNAGLLDPIGLPWKGQNLKQRIKFLRDELQKLKASETTSPTTYEFGAKALYGRLRDAYERFVEEKLFHEVIIRFRSSIKTQELRYVTVSDENAKRFHKAFTWTCLHSHDNPSAQSITAPDSTEIGADIDELENLANDVGKEQKIAEAARPEMKL